MAPYLCQPTVMTGQFEQLLRRGNFLTDRDTEQFLQQLRRPHRIGNGAVPFRNGDGKMRGPVIESLQFWRRVLDQCRRQQRQVEKAGPEIDAQMLSEGAP